jgi:spermidine synthase
LTASLALSAVAIAWWLLLPSDYLLSRALLFPLRRAYTVSEGITELIAVTDGPDGGRVLVTNGHPMSSTELLSQRYMRAMAHIPLLAIDNPERVLVLSYGVGNTARAATLHPTVRRVEVVDLSRHVLEHSSYFKDVNGDVLNDPRVTVFINDGRHHLQMQAPGTYDLITLEPPPIAHAGVGALYSREFYELARTRLKPGGYLSQWLPVYQVPPETSLAMARAFVDVFPQSVLLSGTAAELLLVGTTAPRMEIDPEQLAHKLESAPKVLADLRRLDLGTVKEIVGMFMASAETLVKATSSTDAVSDDRPLQEYGVHSVLTPVTGGVPAELVDLPSAAKWCPRCFNGEESTPAAEGLDAYLVLMNEAYRQSASSVRLKPDAAKDQRILGSRYLAAILPDTDTVHNIVGVTLLEERRYDEAAAEFRQALERREDSPDANRNLGTALAATGHVEEAITYLSRAVQLAPDNQFAQKELQDLQQRSRHAR